MEMAELYHVSWEKKYYRNHYHDLFVSVGAMVSHLQNFVCSHESYCSVAGIMCGAENKT